MFSQRQAGEKLPSDWIFTLSNLHRPWSAFSVSGRLFLFQIFLDAWNKIIQIFPDDGSAILLAFWRLLALLCGSMMAFSFYVARSFEHWTKMFHFFLKGSAEFLREVTAFFGFDRKFPQVACSPKKIVPMHLSPLINVQVIWINLKASMPDLNCFT